MLSNRFEHLFTRLLGAFLRYDDTPRNLASVLALAAARAELEDRRQEIATERDVVMGLGRSRTRDDYWQVEEAIARDKLFTIAHTSN